MKISHIFILSFLFLSPFAIQASVSTGTIESGNKTAFICHSVDCITPTPGVINFAPTGTTPVTIDDTNGIDGVAWGNQIGWINFDPTGIEGVTINSSTGILSGRAWSQGAGWINFSPTGQSVRINSNGEFIGFAWTGGPFGGWIKFDCTFAGACVKTDWRPVASRPLPVNIVSGGSTSQNNISSLSVSDMCLNIPEVQYAVPSNYIKDQGGLCVLNIDYCKNIAGTQLTVPSTMILDGAGQCITLTKENKEKFVPTKMTSASIEIYKDFCPNLFGLQSKVPEGFVENGGECLPQEADYCLNLLGNQYSVPKNMKVDTNGECVKMSSVEIERNNAIKEEIVKTDKNPKALILGYNFIPNFLKKSVPVSFLSYLLGVPVRVDGLSLLITLIILSLIIYIIKRKLII